MLVASVIGWHGLLQSRLFVFFACCDVGPTKVLSRVNVRCIGMNLRSEARVVTDEAHVITRTCGNDRYETKITFSFFVCLTVRYHSFGKPMISHDLIQSALARCSMQCIDPSSRLQGKDHDVILEQVRRGRQAASKHRIRR